MPRRREVYDSDLASRFINKMMKQGKKSVSEKIFYQAMGMIEEKTGEDSMKILKKALDNVKPMLETKSRRVGGSTYQVPIEVSTRRKVSLGIRWIVNYARERGEKVMAERLANEVMEAAANRGSALRKREDVRRMADANKAFAHYRW